MSEAPPRKSRTPATGTIGLGAAVCAGCLDLALSLWLEQPAGLRSASDLLLTLATSTAILLATWLAVYAILSRLRLEPRPLALALAGTLFVGVLLRGLLVALAPAADLGPAAVLLTALLIGIGVLIYRVAPGVAAPGVENPRLAKTKRPYGAKWGEEIDPQGRFSFRSLGFPTPGRPGLGRLLGLLALPILLLLFFLLRTPNRSPQPATSKNLTVPRVLLLSIDTLRADALSSLGGRDVRTPHLDALAGDSLLYTRAYSSAGWTLPAMASVMTGVSPHVHGALHTRSRVPDGLPTLAETLRRAGYRTAAFVSSTVLGPQANLTQGFEEYHTYPGPWLGRSLGATLLTKKLPRFRPDEAPPEELSDAALDWLRAHQNEPFFLWLHFFDPHAPYGPPRRYLPDLQGRNPRFEGWDEEAIRAGTWVPDAAERAWIRQLYLGEVRWADDAAGRFLNELRRQKLYDDTLIVLVSDHGEEFWEHGAYGHGHTLYDELLHVPLLVKLPQSARTGRITNPVTTAGLFSTILDACALPLPTGYPAAGSLLQTIGDRPLHALGLNRFEQRQSIRFGRFKYIRWTMSGKEELYDLERDPGERSDLAASQPAELMEGRRLLAASEAEGKRARQLLRLPEGETVELDAHTRDRLRSLGYAH